MNRPYEDHTLAVSYMLTWLLGRSGLGHASARKFLVEIGLNDLNDREKVRSDIEQIDTDRITKNFPENEINEVKKLLIQEAIRPIPFWSVEFPRSLLRLKDHPLIIYVKGDISLLSRRTITIVGTRKNTLYGARLTRQIVGTIHTVDRNAVIVSGLAYGTDSQAHISALKVGLGTVAITAGGVDRGFPRRNISLYEEIARNGAIMSEFPLGVEIVKGMFPMRNRLLAALSDIVIVVESSPTGGSMITARYAAELGIDLLVVPGDVGRDVAEGCNQLTSEGAIPLFSMSVLKEYLEMI